MSQRAYFQTTPVAVVFNGQAEHKAILAFFGLSRPPLTMHGACSIYRFYSPSLKIHVTYHWHPLPSVYHYNGYTLITFKEFSEITGDDRIRNLAEGVI